MEKAFKGNGNPVIAKMGKREDAYTGEKATFKGIIAKSFYFLALILLGLGAFIYMHSYFANNGYDAVQITTYYSLYANEMAIFTGAIIVTLIAGLVAGFAPRTVPVTGSIYCAGMGYVVTFISYTYAAQVQGIVVEALFLTILLIAIMAVLYFTGIVKVTSRFRKVLYTSLFATIIGSVVFMIVSWLFPNSSIVKSILSMQSGPLGILFAFLGVALGCMLVLDDFETITSTVNNGLSKKYEWTASYGLMISIIYLYLRVLELILRFSKRND
ncbi:MAG: Bax inhibitor-1/YccA family protein [Ruminococcus sp.]|nr:Bax inhibitor-1/YccA family protein [Ruminococcus sp.]